MKKIYCGGRFAFDYLNPTYRELVKEDYRAQLLGDENLLLERRDFVPIHEKAEYIGPFYFESDGMQDKDIVAAELDMVRRCTDAVFLLDDGLCPGTIGELTVASTLRKNVHIFYVQKDVTEETESDLHTPCWYPILLSQLLNENTRLVACQDEEDAKKKIKAWVENLNSGIPCLR